MAELIIGLALCLSALPGALKLACQLTHKAPLSAVQKWGLATFVYLLSVPLITGLLRNMPAADIARDLIPAGFMLMPLFYSDLLEGDKQRQKHLLITACLMGAIFALRTLAQDPNTFLAQSIAPFLRTETSELTYLANAPTLFLGAAMGYYIALYHITLQTVISPRRAVLLLISLAASIVCITAMALTLQRASLILLMLTVLIAHIDDARTKPIKNIVIILALVSAAISIATIAQPMWQTIAALHQKTVLHGVNMRAEEWHAVITALQETSFSPLIGLGWGSGLFSPATSGAYVTFTHGLISASLLKTGVMGLTLTGLYLAALLLPLTRHLFRRPVLIFALLAPIMIDITLYGAYKSLDFGVMLLLAAGIAHNISGENSTRYRDAPLRKP